MCLGIKAPRSSNPSEVYLAFYLFGSLSKLYIHVYIFFCVCFCCVLLSFLLICLPSFEETWDGVSTLVYQSSFPRRDDVGRTGD